MDGNLSRHTRPDGSLVNYAWNARNLLASITSDAPPPLATYTYNLRNQIAATVVENGIFTATRSYDTAGRLTGVSNGSLDTTAYTLSADGRRTGIDRNGQVETYGYDAARQVTSANYGGLATTQSWNYDPAGNRGSATTNGATTTYLANTVNEYTTITGSPAPPMHDANGNAISYPVRPPGSAGVLNGVFTWDIHNQQISATVGSDSATYQYDALGRRTKRVESIGGLTTTTWFLTNGWNVELEHNGTAYTTRQTWSLDLSGSLQGAGGVGGLVMVETLPAGGTAPVPSFPTYDGNGNITAWVDASGSVIARQRYDAFGNIVEQTGTAPSNYGFSTKPIEKLTGFHYYGYRYYDPTTGRWPSRDPIEERGGLNLYGFLHNSAISDIDRLGMEGLDYTIQKVGELTQIVFVAGDKLKERGRIQAQGIMEGAKSAISKSSVSGGSYDFSDEFLKSVGKNAKAGTKVTVPAGMVVGVGTSAAIDMYAYVNWVATDESRAFEAFNAAFKEFERVKDLTSCGIVCGTGAIYIGKIPTPTSGLLSEFFKSLCTQACCENF